MTIGRRRGIRAGRAFVEVGIDNRVGEGLATVQRQLATFANAATRIGIGVVTAVGAIFGPIAALSLKAASDAEETRNRFVQVFGDQAAAAEDWVQRTSRAVGRATTDLREAASVFQQFFVGAGFDSSAAREFSQQFAELAIDFASFNNLSDQEAIDRFISAFSGSGEVLDRFGINIRTAALEQEALRRGIEKTSTQLTEQEKILLRASIISGNLDLVGATGDAIRTADGYANVIKRLGAEFKLLRERIGEALIEPAAKIASVVGAAVASVARLAGENAAMIRTIAAVAAGALAIGVGFLAAGAAIKLALLAFLPLQIAAAALTASLTTIGAIATVVFGLLASPALVVVAALASIGSVLAIVIRQTDNLGGRLDGVFEGFRAIGQAAGEAFRIAGRGIADAVGILGEAFSGVTNALKSGDIALAGEIAATGLRLAFVTAVDAIKLAFDGLWLDLVTRGLEAANTIHRAFTELKSGFQTLFATIQSKAQTVASLVVAGGAQVAADLGVEGAGDVAAAALSEADNEKIRLAERQIAILEQLEKGISANDERVRQAAAEAASRRKALGEQGDSADAKALREKLDELLGRAANPAAGEGGDESSNRFSKLLDELFARESAAGAVADRIETQGTFSGFGAAGLATSWASATLQAQQATAQTAEAILREVSSINILRFG